IRVDATIKDAIATLDAHGITALPVVAGGRRVVGVVSEADLIRDLVAPDPRAGVTPVAERVPTPTTVAEVMSPHAVKVRPDTDLADAIDLMTSTAVKSLPVVDDHDRVVGVVSRRDVVHVL